MRFWGVYECTVMPSWRDVVGEMNRAGELRICLAEVAEVGAPIA